MKLTYETGIASFTQFIIVSLLNIGTQTVSIVSVCSARSNNCLTNALTSIGYFMLIVIMFGTVWQLGYRAQMKRSRRLCQLLIATEALIALIALFNARHHTSVLGLVTSLADFGLCIWVALLAFRLMRARGGRIVASQRARRRHRPDTDL